MLIFIGRELFNCGFKDKHIIPYISKLKNGCFTQYRINQITKLKSVYAIRLYEILICEAWRNQDYEIEVATLKNMLGLADKYRLYVEYSG